MGTVATSIPSDTCMKTSIGSPRVLDVHSARILFTAGREVNYVRNTLVLRALRAARFDVRTVTSAASSYPGRLTTIVPRLALERSGHDLAFAGFFGQPLAIWLRLCQRQPIILDAFVSAYDTICYDRRQVTPHSPLGRVVFRLDSLACAAARLVVVDTEAQADYFASSLGVPRAKLHTVYLGHDTEVFTPIQAAPTSHEGFHVFHYGSYLPLHGTDVIVRAAKLLESERDITFTLAGRGQCYDATRSLAGALGSRNVRFVDWIPYARLPETMAAADLCLGGHFGTSEKARRVIAGKTYQFLAMGRPTIVGDCPANREIFSPCEHAWFCPQGSPEGLAEAILLLKRSAELRHHLGERGRALVSERFSPKRSAQDWLTIVNEALGGTG